MCAKKNITKCKARIHLKKNRTVLSTNTCHNHAKHKKQLILLRYEELGSDFLNSIDFDGM